MFKILFKVLKKFFAPVIAFFSKKLAFIIAPLVAILDLLVSLLTGGAKALFVVWKYTAALFFVHLIRKFVLFPIFALAVYEILVYLWNDYNFSFLDNLSINSYLTNFINSNEFLSMGAVIGYQFGLWQALTIFFNFFIVTFVIRLFIKMFIRE